MQNCKRVCTLVVVNDKLSLNDVSDKVQASAYRSLIGSLLYLISTRQT